MNEKWFCLTCVIVLLALIDTTQADLVGWWKFDEGSGIIAGDSSGFGHNGTLHNMDNNDWVDGVLGKALELDGVDDYISIPSVDLVGINTLTITAWVKRHGAQPIFTGIVYSRDRNSQAGTGIGFGGARRGGYWQANHELSYCWNQDFWKWSSGLVVPNDKWVFIAMVVGPTEATLYLGQDETLSSSTHEAHHEMISDFDGVSMIGHDNYQGSGHGHGHFKGHIDDIRIYAHELDTNEIRAIYAHVEEYDKTSDAEIAKHPDETLEMAYDKLQQFYGPRGARGAEAELTDELASTFLIIAKAKEAKNLPRKDVLKDYYDVIVQFPDSSEAIEALCRVVALDEESGPEYADNFLERDPTGAKAAQFYGTLVRNSLSESNYWDADKYVKSFVDKYVPAKSSAKLIGLLISHVGRVRNHGELTYILDRNVSKDPNSPLRCAVFRYQASELSEAKDFHRLWELAGEARAKFPGTRLALSAAAVLADRQYQGGNYALALQEFKSNLFAKLRLDADINQDIDDVLELYQANTLRSQGIDLVKMYEAVAGYAHNIGRHTVAVYCYKQGAKLGNFALEAFENAAAGSTDYCNTTSDNQVWFWIGLFAAEAGDLTTAGTQYEMFLENDNKSILAARAYYDLARARMVSGLYTEARDLIVRAKTVSPCPAVIQLERDIRFSMGTN